MMKGASQSTGRRMKRQRVPFRSSSARVEIETRASGRRPVLAEILQSHSRKKRYSYHHANAPP